MNDEQENENEIISSEKSIPNLHLCFIRPTINDIMHKRVVLTTEFHQKKEDINDEWKNDGFNSISKNSSIYNIQTYFYNDLKILNNEENLKSCKLLEIAIRDVKLHNINQSHSESELRISSISILFKNTVICKMTMPFKQKLHKLLLQNQSSNFNDLSIRVNAQCGTFSILPLPLLKRGEQNTNLHIQFAIKNKFGKVYCGILICTISLIIQGQSKQREPTSYISSKLNDPNDPKNSIFFLQPNNIIYNKETTSLVLDHSALQLPERLQVQNARKNYESRPIEVSVSEHKVSIVDLRNVFQNKRSLEATASQKISRNYAGRKPVLSITILRGVEVPIREESAIVQPLVEIEWGDTIQSTTSAEGSAPVWHQTLQFPVLRVSDKQFVKLRLYDQHPIWGLQWLGECKIPIECHGEYEELERWIGLDPLQSPALLLGYVQV